MFDAEKGRGRKEILYITGEEENEIETLSIDHLASHSVVNLVS